MKRAVVIGAAPDPHGIELIEPDDFIAVCDGGLGYALSNNVAADILVGDFDSFKGKLPALPEKTAVFTLPPEKDDTDIGYAVKLLLKTGFRDFLILGGSGGRFDHTLGNLAVAAGIAARGGIASVCGTRKGEMTYVFKDRELTLDNAGLKYVSVIPWGCPSATVSASGLKYPLDHRRLSAKNTLGISNEFAAGRVSIIAESGTIAVIVNPAD